MSLQKNSCTLSIALLVAFALLESCTGVKHLSEGEKYYSGADVKFETVESVEGKIDLKQDLIEILAPKPNTKILGSRPSVFFYHLAGEPKKEKGFKNWLKYKVGSEPVLLKDTRPERTASQLTNYLLNKGFFNAGVEYEIEEKDHEASILYTVFPQRAYHLRNIRYPETSGVYAEVIAEIQKETLLDSGMRYDLEALKTEQKRIEDLVENKGFYYFDDNYLIYEADSAVGDHQVDLRLRLDPNTPDNAKRIFEVDSIKLYPDYSVIGDTTARRKKTAEQFSGHTFINDTEYMRRDILTEAIILEPDSLYSHTAESYTLEHLLNLGTFKYVNIKFNQSDSATITSSIYMTPFPKKSIRLKLEGVSKSNNFVGPALGVTFSNRNTFRGGELLEVSLNASYNVQVGGQNQPPLTAYEVGVENTLTFPRFLSPFEIIDYRNWRFMPNTRIKLGARIQERLEVFRLNSLETGYGYLWRTDITKSHEFYPINLSYVQLAARSEEFSQRLDTDPTLFRSLQDQFIIGGTYSYTYNSKSAEDSESKRNHYYFNASTDVSGNLLYLVQSLTGASTSGDGSFEVFKHPYSQYSKGQADFRFYKRFSRDREFATRLQVGLARAYLNAQEVPFIKQFSAGGSNDIRAFHARSLGPGSYYRVRDDTTISEDDIIFFDETGDIKLLASAEYRTQLVGILEGAVFLDAGNIWLWHEQNKEGADFKFNRFYEEIALGTGIGFRFDFSFFILRFDLAFPLYNPRREAGDRWVANEINPLSSDWRQDNLILNIGIGYPF